MNKKMLCIYFLLFALVLSGCTKKKTPLSVKYNDYEKKEYEVMTVARGDFTPKIYLKLKREKTETIRYGTINSELRFDKLYVSVGDKVKKGDLLLTFESEEYQNSADRYEKLIEENNLLIEHYQNLMRDNGIDYKNEISRLQNQNYINSLYLEEINKKLEACRFEAKKDGTIVYIDDYLEIGELAASDSLIRQVCGSGNFIAETDEDFESQKGEIYTAENKLYNVEMKLTDIVPGEDGMKNLIFTPVSDMSIIPDNTEFMMVIDKEMIRDAVYVDKSAINKNSKGYYVYVLDNNGYRKPVYVKVTDIIDGIYIIEDGLSGGEIITIE